MWLQLLAGVAVTLWEFVCMCVNMEKCCPGDTWSCGNYHEGGFEYFGQCLWIDFVMAIETVQMELWNFTGASLRYNWSRGQWKVWADNLLSLQLVWYHYKVVSSGLD